jgi:hypothetical protein
VSLSLGTMHGGDEFNDISHLNQTRSYRIAKISCGWSKFMQSLTVTYADAVGRTYTFPRGNSKAEMSADLALSSIEFVHQIEVFSTPESAVLSFIIQTSEDQKLVCGNPGNVAPSFQFVTRKSGLVAGFSGTAGNWIDSLKVVVARRLRGLERKD